MIAAILVIAFSGSDSGAAGAITPPADSRAQDLAVRASAPVKCHARAAVRFYSRRYSEHRAKMGAPVLRFPARTLTGCPRYLAKVLKRRAYIARRQYELWLVTRTLRDFAVTPGNHAWLKAVDEVQRVFPGTDGWLLSCSDAEGGHGRWVRYGGGSYYPGYEYTDAVGNWMQFRWSTFRGMLRHALDEVRSRGFRVPPHVRDPGDVRAWLSPLGAALAAGWARWSGNDNSHWSASWGNGC